MADSAGTLLTVVVPSISERLNTTLPKILNKLFDQAKNKPVEVMCMLDNKKMTLSEKRNNAIRTCRGAFITFVDDDDDVEPDYTDQILAAINKKPDADCVVFDVLVHGYTPQPKPCRYGVEYMHRDSEEAYYRKPNHIVAYNINIARKYQYINVTDEDHQWSWRACKDIHPAKQVRINKALYHYYYNSSTSQQGAWAQVLENR